MARTIGDLGTFASDPDIAGIRTYDLETAVDNTHARFAGYQADDGPRLMTTFFSDDRAGWMDGVVISQGYTASNPSKPKNKYTLEGRISTEQIKPREGEKKYQTPLDHMASLEAIDSKSLNSVAVGLAVHMAGLRGMDAAEALEDLEIGDKHYSRFSQDIWTDEVVDYGYAKMFKKVRSMPDNTHLDGKVYVLNPEEEEFKDLRNYVIFEYNTPISDKIGAILPKYEVMGKAPEKQPNTELKVLQMNPANPDNDVLDHIMDYLQRNIYRNDKNHLTKLDIDVSVPGPNV